MESRVTRAGLPLVVGDVARFVRCRAARLFRWQPRADKAAWAAAGGWDDATVPPRPVSYHAVIIAERARGSLSGHGARLSAAVKTYRIQCGRFGAAAANPPVVVDKSGEGGYRLGSPGHFALASLPSPPSLHPEPRAKSVRRKKKKRIECTLAIV